MEFFEGEDPEEPRDDEKQQEQQEVHVHALTTLFLSLFQSQRYVFVRSQDCFFFCKSKAVGGDRGV